MNKKEADIFTKDIGTSGLCFPSILYRCESKSHILCMFSASGLVQSGLIDYNDIRKLFGNVQNIEAVGAQSTETLSELNSAYASQEMVFTEFLEFLGGLAQYCVCC